jgi:hypothetical protein
VKETISTPVQSPVETTRIETVGTPAESLENVVIPEQAVVIPPVEEIPTPQ